MRSVKQEMRVKDLMAYCLVIVRVYRLFAQYQEACILSLGNLREHLCNKKWIG
jgi:hypothetical protein